MITDIYSKRQKRLRGEFPDVYQYEDIPNELRNQIIFIFRDNFEDQFCEIFIDVHKKLCREYGWEELCREYGWKKRLSWDEKIWYDSMAGKQRREELRQEKELRQFFASEKKTERVIDVIELSFRYIEQYKADRNKAKKVNGAIKELNIRFREHGVGYQYESGQIIKVDSQYVHSEVVRPVLNLLSDPMYQGANAEFLKAHDHYRKGDYESCIIECSKAFESVLKIICDHRGWGYNPKDTAKSLLEIVYGNGLLPTHTKSFFSGVRSGLEHGVPVIRNKYAAHGQGNQKKSVPDYMAENMLNLTASSILLLVKTNKAVA